MKKWNDRAVISQIEFILQLVFNSRAAVSMLMGDKMCKCGNGGCSACHTRDESPLHFIASGKEIEELYGTELDKDYPEGLWVDSGEMDLESQASSTDVDWTSAKSTSL
jgi:hypothetical protein